MKKALLILLGAALAIAFAACSRTSRPGEQATAPQTEPPTQAETLPPEPDPATPAGAVAELFEAAKSWDVAVIESHLPEGVTVTQRIPEAYQSTLRQVLDRVEYTVGDVVETGDTATVELEITSVDAESALNDAVGAAAAYVAKKKLTGGAIESSSEVVDVILEAVDVAALPAKTSSAAAHLIRGGDGEWKLNLSDESNLPLLNAVSGGMVKLAERLRSLAESYGIQLPV